MSLYRGTIVSCWDIGDCWGVPAIENSEFGQIYQN